MSSSYLSGRTTGNGSLASCIELFFEVFEPGVASPEPLRSGFCIRRWEMLKRSPKLFLAVDVDVRPEGTGGREVMVGDLPARDNEGRDPKDLLEALDELRSSAAPGPASFEVLPRVLRVGDGIGEGILLWPPSSNEA